VGGGVCVWWWGKQPILRNHGLGKKMKKKSQFLKNAVWRGRGCVGLGVGVCGKEANFEKIMISVVCVCGGKEPILTKKIQN